MLGGIAQMCLYKECLMKHQSEKIFATRKLKFTTIHDYHYNMICRF